MTNRSLTAKRYVKAILKIAAGEGYRCAGYSKNLRYGRGLKGHSQKTTFHPVERHSRG